MRTIKQPNYLRVSCISALLQYLRAHYTCNTPQYRYALFNNLLAFYTSIYAEFVGKLYKGKDHENVLKVFDFLFAL